MNTPGSRKGIGLAVSLCLVWTCWALPAGALEIGAWSGYFPYAAGADYYEHPMTVPQDGAVVLTTTADSTFLGQYSAISVRDAAGDAIDFSYIMTSPHTWAVRLEAGNYVVRVGRSLRDWYGNYYTAADLTPANGGATEIENNDTFGAASTNPNNLFAGAIGYWRAKDTLDLTDYYRFTLMADTKVHFDVTTAATLVDFDTVLSLTSSNNITMRNTFLAAPSLTWDLYLAPGTYYVRLYIADWNRYGGYTIATTTTPAVAQSSEAEVNDSIAQADQIQSKKLYGSIGYYRDKNAGGTEFYDNLDYFSCQVAQGGTLSVEILSEETLHSFNNTISIRDASNTSLNFDYLTTSPRTVTVNNLAAGTYYLRVYRSVGQGAYEMNVSGNVILQENPGSLGGPILLLLTN